MTQQPYQAPSADDFLMGGGGAASAKFPQPGASVGGRITERPTVEQQRDIKTGDKKFWNNGDPMMQLVVTVQTDQRDPSIEDDDGKRRLFVKSVMKNAIADAVRSAGAKGLEVGGTLTVTYTHDGVATQRGFDPPKQYSATYTPAAANALLTPDPGSTAPQYAAPAPQPQYVPPVAAPAPQYAAPVQAPAATPALTAEQLNNPAVQALLAQQAAVQAAAATTPPPF